MDDILKQQLIGTVDEFHTSALKVLNKLDIILPCITGRKAKLNQDCSDCEHTNECAAVTLSLAIINEFIEYMESTPKWGFVLD